MKKRIIDLDGHLACVLDLSTGTTEIVRKRCKTVVERHSDGSFSVTRVRIPIPLPKPGNGSAAKPRPLVSRKPLN